MNHPTKEAIRDYLLFAAALVLVGLGLARALEESWPGFVVGVGTAYAILILFLMRGMGPR